jgi:hypothetical protein
MGKLFISYAHEDKPFVALLARALADQGHEVWWDRDLAAGGEYRQQIQLALDTAEIVIVVWSARSRLSRFVADEADQALSKGKLVPVMIDETRPALGFGAIHTIDLGAWSGAADDASLAELGRVIAERLAEGPRSLTPRPLIPAAGATLGLSAMVALAYGSAQSIIQAARSLAESNHFVSWEIARFGVGHAGFALVVTLPMALFASLRARRLGLSRFRAVARPFVGMLVIGLVVALTIGALALVSGVSLDLPPKVRAAQLASVVLSMALCAAAFLGGVRLLLMLARTKDAV